MVLERLKKISVSNAEQTFEYSNFGYSVLGLILENVYQQSYIGLVEDYLERIELNETEISVQITELGNNWEWQKTDAYLSAGGLVSNVMDMLKYAQQKLVSYQKNSEEFTPIATITGSPEVYQKMGIFLDKVGLSWILDEHQGYIWHNGGTGHYNSDLGLNPANNTAVVVLSNLSPSDRIPATVLGIKVLNELKDFKENP